jgi:hypothetical protein
MPDLPLGQRHRRAARQRWECRCSEPPILLAMYEPGGQVEIKLRDRFYLASGCVHATCPRCGTQHILDLRPSSAKSDPPAPAGSSDGLL